MQSTCSARAEHGALHVHSKTETRTETGTGTKKEENLSSPAVPELDLGEPAEDQVQQAAPPKKPKPHAYPAEFERFWAAYPRQVNKIDAHKAWEKARNLAGSRAPEDVDPKEFGAEALFRAVAAFAKDRKGTQGRGGVWRAVAQRNGVRWWMIRIVASRLSTHPWLRFLPASRRISPPLHI